MLQIIPEQRQRRFSDRLMSGLSAASQEGSVDIPKFFGEQILKKKQEDVYKELGLPENTTAFPEAIQKQLVSQFLGKRVEKENAMRSGLDTIKRMRELINSAGPSNYIQGLFPGDTARDRAELEALGRSLIPLVAAGVPIRNQREFDEYRKIITNPNSKQSDLEGALDGLQGLFERSLGHSGSEDAGFEKTSKIKYNPEHPEHKKKAIQLYKKLKDKEKVREALAREFEF